VKCAGCDDEPARFQWSDRSGEGMCCRCGCPYQLKWGGEEREAEGAYPYLNLRDELVEPLRAYFAETGKFTYLGAGMEERPGLERFAEWTEKNRPAVWAAIRHRSDDEDQEPAP
jgi:hypothetical protein